MNTSTTRSATSARTLLAGDATTTRSRRWKWLGGAAVLLAAGLAYVAMRADDAATQPQYRTEEASVGTLTVKVSATGNLQPTNTVDVGSELSGIVEKVFVDDNDSVEKGQVLAQLDLSKLHDAVARSRANLVAAEAQVMQMQATVAEARATLERYRKVAQLSDGKVPSQAEMDAAVANLARAEANEASARASVTQARATLQSDETNLGKAHIRSPINGVVLSREVDPGQTVAASFQAPVLFKLAQDLTQMELQVAVDEADVAQVKAGQQAVFSVDAWPGRQYAAVIRRVGFGSQSQDGVISYRTVLDVDNTDLSLRPGMTGTAEITTLVRENALLVPNGALRFTPATTGAAPKQASRGVAGMLMPRPPRQVPKARSAPSGTPRVWTLRDGQPVGLDVQTGTTNGRVTEIVGGELEPGMAVIIEAVRTPK